ncbi:DUF1289 domain-containing protein [Thalassotalea euphylliae]|uniref:DUF1289 domain-containing protein n=1 Tax=Thalassotalea euphylliae TaxID=1655234 RepID=UPI0036297735
MTTTQLEFFDVPSPCIGVCQSDDKGYCKGCFRTRDERQQWITLSSDDKQKVVKRCVQRKKRKEGVKKTKEEVKAEQKPQPSLFDPPERTTLSTSDDLDFGDFEL